MAPHQHEAETLAGALCDVLGAGYFESFIALLQSESRTLRERILRRAGAPLDVEEKGAVSRRSAKGRRTEGVGVGTRRRCRGTKERAFL